MVGILAFPLAMQEDQQHAEHQPDRDQDAKDRHLIPQNRKSPGNISQFQIHFRKSDRHASSSLSFTI